MQALQISVRKQHVLTATTDPAAAFGVGLFLAVPGVCVVICILKGKWGMAALVVVAGIIPVIGAFRLAKPGSFWARRFYDDAKRERLRDGPGAVLAFTHEIEADKPPGEVFPELMGAVAKPLARHGYSLQCQSEDAATFARTRRGRLYRAITRRPPDEITVICEPRGAGTLLRIAGEASYAVREAFATMTV